MAGPEYRIENARLFEDLIRQAQANPEIGNALHNKTVVFLPEDKPDLSLYNYFHLPNLPMGSIVFLGASKSEGSKDYDTFVIKEPPIKIKT